MFGLFGRNKRYAKLSEKARRLAVEQLRDAREQRRREQGLLYTFKERDSRDRRSGTERRRFALEIEFVERRQSGERRARLDRRGP